MAVFAVIVAAFVASPWPGVLVIRTIFDRGAAAASEALQSSVPSNVMTTTVSYDPNDDDAVMDIYRPPSTAPDTPVIVWIHGGGFVSGRRQDVANYLKILSGQGFVVANVDYAIAPGAHYPAPVRQTIRALDFLNREGGRLGIGAGGFVLGGDSAGAQIAAQTAAVAANRHYARLLGIDVGTWGNRLKGIILFCGVYDIAGMGRRGGILGWFVDTTGWAYSGTRNWRHSKAFATIRFTPYLSADYPPAFISVGNADPLESQSIALAAALKEKEVPVQTLFFPKGYEPRLGHEYQFNLSLKAGQLALKRLRKWMRPR